MEVEAHCAATFALALMREFEGERPAIVSAWLRAVEVWRDRLPQGARLRLLEAAALAADFSSATDLLDQLVRERAPGPSPWGLGAPLRDQAEGWASLASDAEIRAYLAACFRRLPASDRAAFLTAARRAA